MRMYSILSSMNANPNVFFFKMNVPNSGYNILNYININFLPTYPITFVSGIKNTAKFSFVIP